MKRNGLSLRQKTTLAQRLPDDYVTLYTFYHVTVIALLAFDSCVIQSSRMNSSQVSLSNK